MEVRSSYQNSTDFGDILRSLTFAKQPSKIVEFGILDGFSLQALIDSAPPTCEIHAFDIFSEFNGNRASEKIKTKFAIEKNQHF